MVVTSSTFWMVKMPVYQVVRMITMRNCLMPRSRAMLVAASLGDLYCADAFGRRRSIRPRPDPDSNHDCE